MKKQIACILAILMVLSLAACQDGGADKGGTTARPSGADDGQNSGADNSRPSTPDDEAPPEDQKEPTDSQTKPEPVKEIPGADRPKTTELNFYWGNPAEEHTEPATLFVGDGYSLYIFDEGWEHSEEEYGGYTAQVWKSTEDDNDKLWIVNIGQKSWEEAQEFVMETEPDYNFGEDQRGGLIGGLGDGPYYPGRPFMDVGFGVGQDDTMIAVFWTELYGETSDEIYSQARGMIISIKPQPTLAY